MKLLWEKSVFCLIQNNRCDFSGCVKQLNWRQPKINEETMCRLGKWWYLRKPKETVSLGYGETSLRWIFKVWTKSGSFSQISFQGVGQSVPVNHCLVTETPLGQAGMWGWGCLPPSPLWGKKQALVPQYSQAFTPASNSQGQPEALKCWDHLSPEFQNAMNPWLACLDLIWI